MPTIKEALEWCRSQVRQGKGDMHTAHLFVAEEEAQKREDNAPDPVTKKQKTKISFDSQDPDLYSEWHIERGRWMRLAGKSPTLSTEGMIVALRLCNEERVKQILNTLAEKRAQIAAQHVENPEDEEASDAEEITG